MTSADANVVGTLLAKLAMYTRVSVSVAMYFISNQASASCSEPFGQTDHGATCHAGTVDVFLARRHRQERCVVVEIGSLILDERGAPFAVEGESPLARSRSRSPPRTRRRIPRRTG